MVLRRRAGRQRRRGRPAGGDAVIELDDLERAVAAADPSAYLVPPRLLRRVVKRDRGLFLLGPYAARQTTYVVAGSVMAAEVAPAEVGRAGDRGPWPETVILLERPEPEELARTPADLLLGLVWRRLFRARVQSDLGGRLREGTISPAELAQRVASLGRTEFEEVRLVFRQDGWLIHPATDAETYALFAAHFLELTSFVPLLLRATFPAVEDPRAATAVFSADVDTAAVLASTRPPGSPDPASLGPLDGFQYEVEAESDETVDADLEEGSSSETDDPGLIEDVADWVGGDTPLALRARAAALRGNLVRSAILWTRAAAQARTGGSSGEHEVAQVRAVLKQLAARLQSALMFASGHSQAWIDALTPLLRRAGRGFWTPEARLLYDLQRVCLDHEREIYRIDTIGWLLSLGKAPLKRPLPHLREVSTSNHLRSAVRRLPRVKLKRDDRARLESLLRPAVHHAEDALRDRFRATIDGTLRSTWVTPANLPERVAFRKLVEELLDRIVRHGYLTLGDLRDSASQSDLKFPDLAGSRDFATGGRLLEADRALARELEGVHRRGEVYLRWMQRFSMVGFGTAVGRALTLYLALPFGGAYVVLEGLQHLVGLTGAHPELMNRWSLMGLGTLALALINFGRFRRQFVESLALVGRSLRTLLVDVPTWLVDNPLVRRLIRSEIAERVWHLVLKPTLAGLAAAGAGRLLGLPPTGGLAVGVGTFLTTTLLLNTRAGRAFEEATAEAVVRGWRSLVGEFLPGLFRMVMFAFQRLMEWVERVFYAVDEWLRFRSGQSRTSLAVKAVVGPAWAFVEYVGRVAVNVLVEPQINPIKHFPVVTVSHKIILPLTPFFAAALTPVFGPVTAKFAAGTFVLLLPGVFGFLVWELKANWRLYAANRSTALGAVVVGSHGETVTRLLRPGFHSGTLPKAFARLRRSRRRTWMGQGRSRPEASALRQKEALHHVEVEFRRFAERDLVALLAGTQALGGEGQTPSLGAVRLATGRVRLDLLPPGGEGLAARLDVEERRGVLVAGLSQAGWIEGVKDDVRRTLDAALTGWLLKSGVELVQTPGAPVSLDPDRGSIKGEPAVSPAENRPQTAPVVLGRVVVRWRDWVSFWDEEERGRLPDARLTGGTGVLPVASPPDPLKTSGRSRAGTPR